jgi:CRISPR system Cascade subunit CasE
MTLYMVQLTFRPTALVRFLESQGLNHDADENLGYGVHAWMAAVFGDLAPRPFRVYSSAGNDKPPKLLAYGNHNRDALLEHAETFAEPAARVVCDLERELAVAAMPGPDRWRIGQKCGFETLVCPVVRRSEDGVEKDAYLHQADQTDSASGLLREPVYCKWFAERLEGAAEIDEIRLEAFRLVKQLRRSQPQTGSRRSTHTSVRPQALLRGVFRVREPEVFSRKLEHGIGRHRSFGYGMLLLKPA